MRWEVVGLVLGWTIGLISIPLTIIALYSCFLEGLEDATRTFAIPIFCSICVGYLLVSNSGADTSSRVRDREAFASVALGWIPVVVVGAMPFWFGGMFHGPFGAHWSPGSEILSLRYHWVCCTHGLNQCRDSPLLAHLLSIPQQAQSAVANSTAIAFLARGRASFSGDLLHSGLVVWG